MGQAGDKEDVGMQTMNWRYILGGGLAAGALLFSLSAVAGVLLGREWAQSAAQLLGGPLELWGWTLVAQLVAWAVTGLALTWLYASIRPCYGPGPRTAAIAGLVLWAVLSARDASWVSWGFGAAGGLLWPTLAGLPIVVGTAVLVAWGYSAPTTVEEPEDGPERDA